MKTEIFRKVNRIISISLMLNIVLAVSKLTAGILGNSFALLSDGINSFGDCFTSLMVLIVVKVANKKADRNHPYGHEKYEGVIHFVLGIIVLLTGILIIKTSIENLVSYFSNTIEVVEPEIYTIIVAGIAIVIKLFMFFYNRYGAKKYNEVVLKAASIDYLSDLLATSVGLIGIIIAKYGFAYFDYIGSIIIGLVIVKAAVGIIKESVSFLVDQAPKEEIIQPIRDSIMNTKGVVKIDDLKIRMHMTKLYVDLEIAVNSELTLLESHEIAEMVHDNVENENQNVIHCLVHVNPYIIEK